MSINILGAFIAAVLSLGLGFLWYSKILFGKRWLSEMNISPNEQKTKGMTGQIAGGFIGELLIALIFSFMMQVTGVFTYGQALALGFWLWLGFMMPIMLGSFLWERKSPAFFLINSSYRLLSILLIGIILILI